MKRYFSIREAAEKWGVSERRINQYCIEGRIPGAQKVGRAWTIPVGARKPEDPRQNRRKAAPAMSGSAVGGTLLDHTCLLYTSSMERKKRKCCVLPPVWKNISLTPWPMPWWRRPSVEMCIRDSCYGWHAMGSFRFFKKCGFLFSKQ